MGLVQVAVTGPGYADGEYAGYGMPGMMVCIEIPGTCREEPVPGTDEEVLVVEDDPEYGWSLAVLYERPDGSMAGLAVDALFGNNSLVPVASVGITLEQAIAFVTDPELRIDDVELAEAAAAWAEESEQPANTPDYSNSEVIPAPAIRDMTDAEARTALDACTEGVPAGTDWSDFEPEFGVWIATTDAGEESLVIATRGDTKMECRNGGASLFGTPEVKGSPYLRGAVAYTSTTLGRHVSDVALVTVQPSSGRAFEAAMKNGYWFLATAVGSLPDPVIRGYDVGGELVYDSTDVDPNACYTDPDGTEVVFYRTDEVPPVEDCLPALEWDY
jgi:hypothetical protein